MGFSTDSNIVSLNLISIIAKLSPISHVTSMITLYCSKHSFATTFLHHTRGQYNYNSDCLLVPSGRCYRILCELPETGSWNSPSGDSTV